MLYTINDTALSALGSVIRSKTGGQGLLTPTEMANAVGTLYGTKDVFYNTVYGTDTNTLTVSLPWKPSVLFVGSQDAAGWSAPLTYMGIALDMDAVGERKAVFYLADSTGAVRFTGISAGAFSDYLQYSGGILTFTPPQSSYYGTSLWRSTVQYTVFAKRSVTA